MASTAFTLTESWSATNRYTAAADIDILLSNPGAFVVHWSTTSNDTVPAIVVGQGHPILPGRSIAMQIKTGDRLWMAGPYSLATLEV